MNLPIVHPRIRAAEAQAADNLLTAEAAMSLAHEFARLLQREAWGVFTGACWHCGGYGSVPYGTEDTTPVACLHCDGTGDLDGARLREAYRIGRREALAELGHMQGWLASVLESRERYGFSHLKAMVGR